MITDYSLLVLDAFRDTHESTLLMSTLRARVSPVHYAALQSGIAFGVGEGWWEVDSSGLSLTTVGRVVLGARTQAA